MNKSAVWPHVGDTQPRRYLCAYCDTQVAGGQGAIAVVPPNSHIVVAEVRICHLCKSATFFDGATQIPSPPLGMSVQGLPEKVAALYAEARKCTSVGAFSAAVLTCRTILMHVAVDVHADKEKAGKFTFNEAVEYLDAAGYIAPKGKPWVHKIRDRGNEVTHDLEVMTEDQAETILHFLGWMLKFIYEMESMLSST